MEHGIAEYLFLLFASFASFTSPGYRPTRPPSHTIADGTPYNGTIFGTLPVRSFPGKTGAPLFVLAQML